MSLATLNTLLAIAAHWQTCAHHRDVPSAYVRATLKDEIYMNVPAGMVVNHPDKDDKRLKLRAHKSSYGLKQSGREWNAHLTKRLIEIGFTACLAESCLFFKQVDGQLILVGVYVDDLVVVA